MLSKTKTNSAYLFQLLSAFLGILFSVYLLVQHTRLKSGIQDTASFCSLGGFADCDIVSASQYAEILGIPVASLGAVFFFALLALGLIAPPKEKIFRFSQWVLLWFVTAGVCFESFFIWIIQPFFLKTVCLFCVAAYLCVLAFLYFTVRLAERPLYKKNGNWAVPELATPRILISLLCFVLFVVVVALLPYFIRQKGSTYTYVDTAMEQFYSQWKDKPVKKIETIDGNGTFGNPSAGIQIVEFSDFQCPFCKKAAFTLHTILKPLKDRVYFTFKNFPLDSTCNPALPYQMHAHACKLARLAYCAEKKGKFWEYHDQVFLKISEDQMKEGFDTISDSLKDIFSKDEIKACLENPKSLASISDDMKKATALNVRATPTLYINGKQVSIPITIETVRKLIDLESNLSK